MPGPAALFLNSVLHQEETCVGPCLRNWKIGFAAILFFEGLVFGHIVYLIKRLTSSSSRRFSYIFHLGNALSGGVFFAAGVLHILPEAIALMSGEHAEEGEEENQGDERWISLRQEIEGPDVHSDEESESDGFPWAFLILMLSFYALFFIEKILVPKLLGSKSITSSESDEETGQLKTDAILTDKSNGPIQTKGFKSQEFVTGIVEIMGISAHSLFESIALGLSGSFSTVLNIFIATVSHRWATSSALGFKLLISLNYLPFLVLLLLFSTIVPIGIGIGAALGNLSETVQGVLFSISAGTFVYIGVYEVMAEEFVEHRDSPLTKFVMALVGASIIVVVTILLNVFDVHG